MDFKSIFLPVPLLHAHWQRHIENKYLQPDSPNEQQINLHGSLTKAVHEY